MQQLYYQLSILQQQLAECMERLEKMEQRLEERTPVPSTVHIEKIEYKFDQLKVETLEGTLSIGLSPTELTRHGEVEIPGLQPNNSIHDQTKQFINEQIPLVFSDCQVIYDPVGNPIPKENISEQLLNQLPQRIEHIQTSHHGQFPLSNEQLTAMIQRDVSHALHALRSQQPASNGEEGQP